MAVYSKFVGMDVHKETIVVSVVEPFGGEVRYLGEFRNTPEAVVKLIRQLRKGGRQLVLLLRSWAMRLWPAPAVAGNGHHQPGGGAILDSQKGR